MTTNFMILLTLNLLVMCTAYFESPIIRLQGKARKSVSAWEQAAAILNVSVPGNWADLMYPTSTSGSYGQANVGMSTINTSMTTWSLPEQFQEQAINSVKLLITASTDGLLLAQAFIFDIPVGTALTTLIVIVTKIRSPTDPNLPFSINYVTINTHASLKQLHSAIPYRRCFTCSDCFWTSKCCCKDEVNRPPRGHTPEELQAVKQKMAADQFNWFNQQNVSSNASTPLVKRDVTSNKGFDQTISLLEAIEKFLSSKTTKAEVLASYNDSVLQAIQTNITSLKLSSQALKMNRIERENMLTLLNTLAEENGFENIYSKPQYAQQLNSLRFSYENLFTSETDTNKNDLMIKYIWIIGQLIDNSTYTLNFLVVNINSKPLLEAMLLNNITNGSISSIINDMKPVNIVRTSTLASNGEFTNENLQTLVTPWQQKTTQIVLNMLRFVGASVLIPRQFRMLSYFNPNVIQPGTKDNSIIRNVSPKFLTEMAALAKGVSAVTDAIKGFMSLFSSSTSTTVERIVRFGFNYFQQRSTVLKALNIPSNRAQEFINAVIIDYNLPSNGSFMLALTYSDDFTWDQINYLYSPSMNGQYRSLTIFKTGNSVKDTASFFIVDINSNWTLAPDLLFITKTKSSFGGLFSSTSQSIQEVPHSLTFDEAMMLQKFFMALALGNMASILGTNVTYPQLT